MVPGLMPYWMLLPVQLVMIVGMLWIVRDFACVEAVSSSAQGPHR